MRRHTLAHGRTLVLEQKRALLAVTGIRSRKRRRVPGKWGPRGVLLNSKVVAAVWKETLLLHTQSHTHTAVSHNLTYHLYCLVIALFCAWFQSINQAMTHASLILCLCVCVRAHTVVLVMPCFRGGSKLTHKRNRACAAMRSGLLLGFRNAHSHFKSPRSIIRPAKNVIVLKYVLLFQQSTSVALWGHKKKKKTCLNFQLAVGCYSESRL